MSMNSITAPSGTRPIRGDSYSSREQNSGPKQVEPSNHPSPPAPQGLETQDTRVPPAPPPMDEQSIKVNREKVLEKLYINGEKKFKMLENAKFALSSACKDDFINHRNNYKEVTRDEDYKLSRFGIPTEAISTGSTLIDFQLNYVMTPNRPPDTDLDYHQIAVSKNGLMVNQINVHKKNENHVFQSENEEKKPFGLSEIIHKAIEQCTTDDQTRKNLKYFYVHMVSGASTTLVWDLKKEIKQERGDNTVEPKNKSYKAALESVSGHRNRDGSGSV